MVYGWKPVVIPEEIYDKAKEHYDEHKEDLELREGIRSIDSDSSRRTRNERNHLQLSYKQNSDIEYECK